MPVAVFDSEFCWLTIVVWLVSIWNAGSEWQPLEECANLWTLVVWIDRKTQMIVDTVIESGQLSSLGIVVDVLTFGWGIELVLGLAVGNECGVGSIIDFRSFCSKSVLMVEEFSFLSIVLELIGSEVIAPSLAIVKLSGIVIVIPFHCWVVSQKSFKLGQLEDSTLSWKR